MGFFDFLKPKASAEPPPPLVPVYQVPALPASELVPYANQPWRLSLEFTESSSKSFPQILKVAQSNPGFREQVTEGIRTYSIHFGPDEILKFDDLYKKVKIWKSTVVYVNGQLITSEDVSKWLRCFRDCLKYQYSNPLFCYGASPYTFNLFGCHRTMIRDAFPESSDNWYEFGQMRADGVFLVDKQTIALKMLENLRPYRFCPALSLEALQTGFKWIPDEINPKRDPLWNYVLLAGSRVPIGVVPKMTDIIIDQQKQTIMTATGKIDITMGLHFPITVTPHFKELIVRLQGARNRPNIDRQ